MSAAEGPTASTSAAARWVLWLVLAVGGLAMLRLNLPGHLSVDSVLALHEGRFGVRTTWNPAIYGWLLGILDRVVRGTSLVVILSGLCLFGSWAALAQLRPRTSWLAPAVALGVIALPQALIYPAIVWKDVLFADAAVAGFVVLATALRRGRVEAGWLALSIVLFAAAGLLRQNGLILAVAAATALAWALWARGWGRSLVIASAWLAAVAVVALVFSALAQPQGAGTPDQAGGKGLRILAFYDIAAAAHLKPGRPTPHIDRVAPAVGDHLRANADRLYSPERVDVLGRDAWLKDAVNALPDAVIVGDWRDLVTREPGLWLRARWLAFEQVAATPIIDRCLPVTLGVHGPPETLKALGMKERMSRHDARLYNYVTWFLDTPAMSHLAYGVVAAVVGLVLLCRRDPADLVIAGFMAGSLAFALSFFAISIACDYRYLYLLDLAALTGVLYLALDPTLRRAEPPQARRRSGPGDVGPLASPPQEPRAAAPSRPAPR